MYRRPWDMQAGPPLTGARRTLGGMPPPSLGSSSTAARPPPTAAERMVAAAAMEAKSGLPGSPGTPPSTPGAPRRMTVAARSLVGSYPGKSANQDSFLMQPLQPLKLRGNGGGEGGGAGAGTSPGSIPSRRMATASRLGGSQMAPAEELTVSTGGDAIIGVYDGHGQNGHHVSKFIKERLALELGKLGDSELGDESTAAREFTAAHHRANEALKKSGIDCSLSGSTAVTCLKRGRRLLVSNVGDSRAVLGQADAAGRIRAKDLSVDQKPDAPSERARIEGGGGHVHPSIVPGAGFVGPARVWDPSHRFGLACSRSLGDTVYYGPNRSGVIADPEVTTHRLNVNDKFVILGSDGVWDRVSSQEAVDLARGCKDVEQASERITQVARERWRQCGPGADDITAVVVGLD